MFNLSLFAITSGFLKICFNGFLIIFLFLLKKICVIFSRFFGFLILKYFFLGAKLNSVLSILGLGKKELGFISNSFFIFNLQFEIIDNLP